MRKFLRADGSKARMVAALVLSVFILGACSQSPDTVQTSSQSIADPYEKTNRAVFKFNKTVDKVVLRPISKVYKFIVPKPVRKGVTNVLVNLRAPLDFANALLQGKTERAGETFQRFLANSTVGIGGLFNVSKKAGIPTHNEDFGQTLAVWGVGDGNFVMLPFLGPSTIRDGVGAGVDFLADPVTITLENNGLTWLSWTRFGLTVVDARYRNSDLIDSIYEESDPYIMMRSAWVQARRDEIRDGELPPPDPDAEDLFDDLEDEEFDEDDGAQE